jgi:hypothetical protein
MPLIVINERARISKRERKRMKKEQKRLELMEIKPSRIVEPPPKSKKMIAVENKIFKGAEETLLELQKTHPHDMRVHKWLAKLYGERKLWPEVEERE